MTLLSISIINYQLSIINYQLSIIMYLGFDPGKDKCGIAVMNSDRCIIYHQVIPSHNALITIEKLCQEYQITTLIMGDQTTSKKWKQQLTNHLPETIKIVMVDERYTSLKARDRYWQMYPPTGFTKLIPQTMRDIPRPIDDIVAILLLEKYFS